MWAGLHFAEDDRKMYQNCSVDPLVSLYLTCVGHKQANPPKNYREFKFKSRRNCLTQVHWKLTRTGNMKRCRPWILSTLSVAKERINDIIYKYMWISGLWINYIIIMCFSGLLKLSTVTTATRQKELQK